jgi:hypothetical protein
MSDGSSICNGGFDMRLACAACITYAWRGWLHSCAWAKKTFLLNLYRFIDTQGRGAHGPDERGLERLFTHNVKLYNCAVGMRG